MGHKTKPRIDIEDRMLMEKIARYGFLDMCFILKFYKIDCKQRTIDERINQLAKYGFLKIRKMFIPHDYILSGKTGYKAVTLGREGLQMMNALGYPVTDYRDTLRNAASYRVYHQVQVATVCECVKQAFNLAANSKFKVDRILSEKESCLPKRINQPDAIILFKRIDQEFPGKIAIFIELERSYASKDRIHSKLASYAAVFEDKAYSKYLKTKIIAQRVLFISQTDLQIETIHHKIEQSPFSKEIEILTAKYSDVCNQTLETVYHQPVTNNTYRLLQKMSTKGNKKE
ncbi:hypothetical protein M2475_002284 [Breznakia sp. PF5-3]|uniref:hypothetical protein n=1 Tax=unclassified Breznakia TaxID=2623764 RepID=UPI002406A05A|nr:MULTISPECIES: hypothetical protein [unclassified Breznakia]MDF9825903.1 hypothetical protein [Breznakia sp. PM6-1]MDF9836698.1 hypothetical protein [Breznakia sp. PF5-3]MDF9838989.1 hypothetical protein [Breznakia sp. PFB2-8]MDF9861002.1 hypothetical protein [Breznakia sp. PH5-24]